MEPLLQGYPSIFVFILNIYTQQQILLILSPNHVSNLFTPFKMTISSIIQATIIFCLDFCNKLTSISASTFASLYFCTPHSNFMSLPLSLSLYPFIHLPAHSPTHPSIHLFTHPPTHLFQYMIYRTCQSASLPETLPTLNTQFLSVI